MKYKFIKKVNWPWVEVDDGFSGSGTVLINMNEVTMIWDRAQGKYKYGVQFKGGNWFDLITEDGLRELKDLLLNKTQWSEWGSIIPKIGPEPKPSINPLSPVESMRFVEVDPDTLHEKQSLHEWLNEEGQA